MKTDATAAATGLQTGSKHPEHEKLRHASGESQAIGSFLDWLETGGLDTAKGLRFGSIELAFHEEYWDPQCGPDGDHVRSDHLDPLNWKKYDILAAYFEIDQDKLEAEKLAMLAMTDDIRELERRTCERLGIPVWHTPVDEDGKAHEMGQAHPPAVTGADFELVTAALANRGCRMDVELEVARSARIGWRTCQEHWTEWQAAPGESWKVAVCRAVCAMESEP